MINIKKLSISLLIVAACLNGGILQSNANEIISKNNTTIWKNDYRNLLSNDKAVIYALVIRNFNARDIDGNGLIEKEKGEQSGNFINAVERLDELKSLGINTLHLLPVTPVGKIQALGTAGSVYSLADFASINPELDMPGNNMSVMDEAKFFVQECHKRGIRVMIDLPACGSVDLFNKHPELFMLDKDGNSIIPLDWRDVRLYNVWKDKDKKVLNQSLLDKHKQFIDMCIDLGIDGIRADVAALKPPKFWNELIKYARNKDAQFGFLAESSDFWRNPVHKDAPSTQPEQLLGAGFDAYYGSYFRIDEWDNAADLNNHVLFNLKLTSSYKNKKSVIGCFATHDEKSPVTVGGVGLSKLISVLEVTLPALNPYFISGFESGDTYIYPFANKYSKESNTDSNYHFVHDAKLDIFNYSRKPGGNHPEIADLMKNLLEFRKNNEDLITKGKYIPLPTLMARKSQIIAFGRVYNKQNIIVIANKDFNYSRTELIGVNKHILGNKVKVLFDTEGDFDYIKFKNSISVNLKPSQAVILKLDVE